MFFIYAISSLDRKYIYVGFTSNLRDRIKRHNSGRNRTTRPYRPFKLIYIELVDSRTEARQREIYFKSGIGKEFLKQL